MPLAQCSFELSSASGDTVWGFQLAKYLSEPPREHATQRTLLRRSSRPLPLEMTMMPQGRYEGLDCLGITVLRDENARQSLVLSRNPCLAQQFFRISGHPNRLGVKELINQNFTRLGICGQ